MTIHDISVTVRLRWRNGARSLGVTVSNALCVCSPMSTFFSIELHQFSVWHVSLFFGVGGQMRQYVPNDQPWPGTNIAPAISLNRKFIVLWMESKCQYIQKRRNSISESHLSSSAGRNAVVRQQQGHTILSDSTVRFNRFREGEGKKKLARSLEGRNKCFVRNERTTLMQHKTSRKVVI